MRMALEYNTNEQGAVLQNRPLFVCMNSERIRFSDNYNWKSQLNEATRSVGKALSLCSLMSSIACVYHLCPAFWADASVVELAVLDEESI